MQHCCATNPNTESYQRNMSAATRDISAVVMCIRSFCVPIVCKLQYLCRPLAPSRP